MPIKSTRQVAIALGTSRDRRAPIQVTSCDLRERREHLRAAMDRLGVEVNHVALDWGCDHSYVVKVLTGEKAWPELRMKQLAPELQAAMAEEACKDHDILTGPRAALIGAVVVAWRTK